MKLHDYKWRIIIGAEISERQPGKPTPPWVWWLNNVADTLCICPASDQNLAVQQLFTVSIYLEESLWILFVSGTYWNLLVVYFQSPSSIPMFLRKHALISRTLLHIWTWCCFGKNNNKKILIVVAKGYYIDYSTFVNYNQNRWVSLYQLSKELRYRHFLNIFKWKTKRQ